MTAPQAPAEDLLVSVSPDETRVALTAQGLLQEIYIEPSGARSILGNIYKGRVARVLPGLQSAFVDLGLERKGFLHLKELFAPGELPETAPPSIASLLREGQEILVQAIKEAMGSKGPRVTGALSLASRLLAYLPKGRGVSVSRRIEDEAERQRLVDIMQQCPGEGGYILRTAAAGAEAPALAREAQRLHAEWQTVLAAARQTTAPSLIRRDLPLPLKVARDLVNVGTGSIVTDDADAFAAIQGFLADSIPDRLASLQLAADGQPLFHHGLEEQLEAALQPRVPLASGGHLVIDQTEAMTTIDVNTGGFVGQGGPASTVLQTNLEAAAAIPRQLRLRNLAGIIVIDFIDMTEADHQRQLLETLAAGMQADRVPHSISGLSELGLVEMTRKRTYPSLMQQLCEPCSVCGGHGFVRAARAPA